MNADEFRKAAHAAIEEIINHSESVASGSLPPLSNVSPGYLRPLLPSSAPQNPESWHDQIQPDVSSKIIPGITHWQSPNFMAFFPACATYPSILGEMYSAAFTAPAFNWLCSPACTELETIVLDWLAQAFDLPATFHSQSARGGGGVIQGSASEAIVTCMVAARERFLQRKCDVEGIAPAPSRAREDRIAELRGKLIALSSDQAHSSTAKGALIAGTRYRSIPTRFEDQCALQPDALERVVKECQAEGLEPYYITLTMGTTSTGATDDFVKLKEVLDRLCPETVTASTVPSAGVTDATAASVGEGDDGDKRDDKGKETNVWIHIDAAYSGTALVCPEYSTVYSPGLIAADSFNTNMHKWMLVSFDASCLWVQRRTDLTRALSISAAYYENKHSDTGLVTDYRDWQIPLGRRFRALKIWFVMRSYGVEGMRAHIRKTVGLGEMFAREIVSASDEGDSSTPKGEGVFELVTTPVYGLTCFRLKPGIVKRRLELGFANSSLPSSALPATTTAVAADGSGAGAGASTTETMKTDEKHENEDAETKAKLGVRVEAADVEAKEGRREKEVDVDVDVDADVETTTNRLTKQITDTINDRREIFLTSSSAHEKTFIRVVCGNTNANENAMRRAVAVLKEVAEEVLSQFQAAEA